MKNIFDYNVVMKTPEFLLCFHKCEIEPRPERVKSGVYINDVKGLSLVYTFMTVMASRGCVNTPDRFCYICGELLVKKQERKLTNFVEKV